MLEYVRRVGIAKSGELADAGFHRVTETRLVRAGRLRRLGRGLYALPDHELSEWHDLAEIAKTIPSCVVCLVSALAFHGIGTQVPHENWIALPASARTPKSPHRLRVSRFSGPGFSTGIEQHEIEGVAVKIYSPAKTAADCFRMRSKVGYDVAIEALREGLREGKFTIGELMRYAKLERVDRIIRPYVEALA